VLKLVSDENFNADILRGLYRQDPDLDVVRVQDIGLKATPDSDILAWAAAEGRILLTPVPCLRARKSSTADARYVSRQRPHASSVAHAPGLPVRSNPSILRRLGTEPAFGDHFLLRVESNGVSTLRIEITVKRTLPAPERKERHRRGHAEIDA
jgi:hypothetical protein